MNRASGAKAWLWQRITAAFLVIILAIHISLLHYGGEAQLQFASVALRLKGVFYLLVDFFLLGFGLYHGLNGFRNVIFDYNPSDGAKKALTALLWVAGLALFIYGGLALFNFMRGQVVVGG